MQTAFQPPQIVVSTTPLDLYLQATGQPYTGAADRWFSPVTRLRRPTDVNTRKQYVLADSPTVTMKPEPITVEASEMLVITAGKGANSRRMVGTVAMGADGPQIVWRNVRDIPLPTNCGITKAQRDRAKSDLNYRVALIFKGHLKANAVPTMVPTVVNTVAPVAPVSVVAPPKRRVVQGVQDASISLNVSVPRDSELYAALGGTDESMRRLLSDLKITVEGVQL